MSKVGPANDKFSAIADAGSVDAGDSLVLRDVNGIAKVVDPSAALTQVLAFTAPSPTSGIGGGNILIALSAMDNSFSVLSQVVDQMNEMQAALEDKRIVLE